jgi:hypothetical protein
MAMSDFSRFQEAQKLLEDPTRRKALEVLRQQTSASGWSIAKFLNQDPQTVGQALNDLRSGGLIDTENGDGLEGFYFLTGFAYQLMSSAAS